MSIVLAVTLGVALGQQPKSQPAPPKLAFAAGAFTATVAGKSYKATTVPLGREQQTSTSQALYRKDDAYAVWDSRGLSMRKGGKLSNSRLTGAPLSDKLWSRLEIAQNRVLLDVGGYEPAAKRLLDHRRVGSEVYFLARWLRPDGSTWFDALFVVDLSSKTPVVQLLERMSESIGSHGKGYLGVTESSMDVFDRAKHKWNLVSIDRKSKKSERTWFEGSLLSVIDWGKGTFGVVETTDYETQTGSRLDLKTRRKTELVEAKGAIGFLNGEGAAIAWIRDGAALSLVHLESGGKLKLDPAGKFRRIGPHVVAWTEVNGPNEAGLYNPDRWIRLTGWKRPEISAKPKTSKPIRQAVAATDS